MLDKKSLSNFVNIGNFKKSFKNFKKGFPFDHCIIDNFFKKDFANHLSIEFPKYNKKNFWHEYNNSIEVKKTCNDWNKFGDNTYLAFTLINSDAFVSMLSKFSGIKLFPDMGLNGGGLHIHKNGGKLNFHLDYDKHPKIKMQRKINLLVYLTKNWSKDYGGELGFWSHDHKRKQPKKLIKKVVPKFNRAVFFDTTQNSWHGLINRVKTKKGITRNSIAAYYLTDSFKNLTNRSKALFAPTSYQKNNKKIIELIEKRSKIKSAKNIYVNK